MFTGNIFANGSLSTKFAKILSHENFPLYGLCSHNLVTAHSHACMAYSNTIKYSTQCITQLCDANIVRACYGKVSDQPTHTYMIYFHHCGHYIALQCTCIIKHYQHKITCYVRMYSYDCHHNINLECMCILLYSTSTWARATHAYTLYRHDLYCIYIRTYIRIYLGTNHHKHIQLPPPQS